MHITETSGYAATNRQYLDSWSNAIYIPNRDTRLPRGILNAWTFYARRAGQIVLQVRYYRQATIAHKCHLKVLYHRRGCKNSFKSMFFQDRYLNGIIYTDPFRKITYRFQEIVISKQQNSKSVTDASFWVKFISKNSNTLEIEFSQLSYYQSPLWISFQVK